MTLDGLDPVTSATVKVVGMMAGLTVQPGTPAPYDQAPPEAVRGVTATIPFTGEVQGRITLVLPTPLLLELTGLLLGQTPETVQDEARDTIGELVNIICGETRRQYAEHGYELSAGIPEVQEGAIPPPSPEDVSTVVPFTTPDGHSLAVVLHLHGPQGTAPRSDDQAGSPAPARPRPVKLFRYSRT